MMKFVVNFFAIVLLYSCSSEPKDLNQDSKNITKEPKRKEVSILKGSFGGMGNSNPFNTLKGEFYIVAKCKNDCDKNFPTKHYFEIELTRPNKYGSKEFDSFQCKELGYGESSVDTFRVFKSPGQFYMKYYLEGNCKADIEIIDIQ